MTNEERDRMILETHDAVIPLKMLSERHDRSLYGDGSKDNPGVISRMQAVEQTHSECPARRSFENEKTNGKDSLLSKHLDKLINIVLITLLSMLMAHLNGKKIPPNLEKMLESLPQTTQVAADK